jgi:hypothetical protein
LFGVTARNCRQLADILALVLGLALFPLAASLHTGVDILISGVSAGSRARWRACRTGRAMPPWPPDLRLLS